MATATSTTAMPRSVIRHEPALGSTCLGWTFGVDRLVSGTLATQARGWRAGEAVGASVGAGKGAAGRRCGVPARARPRAVRAGARMGLGRPGAIVSPVCVSLAFVSPVLVSLILVSLA